MTFEELLDAGRRAESLEDVGGLWDELATAYGATVDGYAANTSELETRIADLEAAQVQLMAENYRLMTALAAGDTEEEVSEEEDVSEEDGEDEGEDSIADYIEED